MFRTGSLCGLLAASVLLAVPVHAGDDWQTMAFVSSTLGNNAGRLCAGAPGTNRPSDLGCPTYAPYVTSAGNVGIGTSAPDVALDVVGSIDAYNGYVSATYYFNAAAGGATNTDLLRADNTSVLKRGTSDLQYGTAPYWQTHALYTNALERLRITSSGNVGIGTAAPQATLQVSGSFIVSTTGQNSTPTLYVGTSGRVGIGTSVPTASNNKLFIYDPSAFLDMRVASGANSTFMGTDSSRGYIGTYSSVPLFIQTSATTRVAINATGDVGIGTSSPNAKLDVAGTISSTGISVTGIITATYFEGNGSRLTGITAAATAASSTGAIQFNVANAMAGDGANLFWDDANNRLGIGTVTPIAALDVNGNIYAPGGFVSATYYFNALAGGLTNSDVIRVNNVSLVKRGTSDIQYGNNSYWQTHSFYTNGSERFRINGSGNVGISTTNPNAKLEVNGLVSSTGLSVTGIVTATYFEGNGSRLTGLSVAAATDRIVSGTSSVVVNENAGISFTTAGTARMAIDRNGNVALGTSLFNARLAVVTPQSALNQMAVGYDNTYQLLFGAGSGNAQIQAVRQGVTYNHPLSLQPLAGKVGIGTTAPQATLEVSGTIRIATTDVETCADGSAVGTIRINPARVLWRCVGNSLSERRSP